MRFKLIATILTTIIAGFAVPEAASAQGPLYNSSTYLHVSNATLTCKRFNAQAADHTMYSTVGWHIVPPGNGDTYPELGYSRYSNRELWVGNIFTSWSLQSAWKIQAACVVRGVDTNHYVYSAWVGAVYQ